MILDVGCGDHPKGDVNVDLPRGGDYGFGSTRANVIASVHHLPFRDKSFEVVLFRGLLHHLKTVECTNCGTRHDDCHGWQEMLRVCNDVVLGYEPNINFIYPRDRTEKHHLYARRRTLGRILQTHSGFSLSVDRVWLIKQKRTDWRIIGLRHQQTAKQMAPV